MRGGHSGICWLDRKNNNAEAKMMDNEENAFMQTFTGKYVEPLNLKYEDIDIVDIAHHLSLICRFNGACREFYSVAQHSLFVVHLVPKEDSLTALLHDASEAYMADIIRPIKFSIPELQKIEDGIAVRILAKFECFGADWEAVKRADNIMLATESRDLMTQTDEMDRWHLIELPQNDIVVPWSPNIAETAFLDMFKKVKK